MKVKRKTFEDFVGNVADDTKDAIDRVLDDAKLAFDEVFERTPESGSSSSTSSATGLPLGPKGAIGGGVDSAIDVAAAIGKLSVTVSALSQSVEALAALPEPIAELTNLISSLLPALQAMPAVGAGTVGSGRATQAAKTGS